MKLQMLPKSQWPYILYHVLGWIIFIAYEVSITIFITGIIPDFFYYVVYYFINICLFYFNASFIFPFSFKKKRTYILLPLLIIAELAVYIPLIILSGYFILYLEGTIANIILNNMEIVKAAWRGVYFILLSTAFWFAKCIVEQRKSIALLERDQLLNIIAGKELEQSLMHSQNAYLQSRLNPHLLFNTLNFLYDFVYDISSEASKSIVLLSDIIRYSLQEPTKEGKTHLAKEIECIESYIALHQLKVRNKLNINTDLFSDNPDAEIIPLLLLSFVENVFKHGSFSDPDKSAFIMISLKNGILKFYSRNHKKDQSAAGFGLGISNNRIRLENYYPGKYSLTLNDSTHIYELVLVLHL